MKKPLTIESLYQVKGITQIVPSPIDSSIAIVRTDDDLKKGIRNTNIFLISDSDGSPIAQVTHSGKASSPLWNRTGTRLYFIDQDTNTKRKRKKNDHGDLPQLFAVRVRGNKIGKPQRVTNCKWGVSHPTLSDDETKILFRAQVTEGITAKEKNYHEADSLLYRHWTEWRNGKYEHILLYDTVNKSLTDLTPGPFDSPTFDLGGDKGYDVSPDFRWLCFNSNRTSHPAENTRSDLWTLRLDNASASCQRLTLGEDFAWSGTPKFSDDGKRLAFRFQQTDGYESDLFRLAVAELHHDRWTLNRTFTLPDHNWIDDFIWNRDDIILHAEGNGCRPLFRLSPDGHLSKITDDVTISTFAIKGDDLFDVHSAVDRPSEIYKNGQQLTHLNDRFLAETMLSPVEKVWVEGALGDNIQLFIVKPVNFEEGKKYPLILNVHGGPQQQWTDSWRGDYQLYPANGYVVAFCNPHGSTGYGQPFTRAISGHWGDTPFEDLMKVTDFLEQLPYVDKNRMGAMGWSFGGYMTNWFQARTKRFKCLASMMGVYNLKSMWGATEELWFPQWDLQGKPWDSALYTKFSPSEYVNDFATPTLIITGEKDFRVPYTQSLEYFSALQSRGIESRLIVFKEDGHWPHPVKSMPTYYREHLKWFDQHL